MKDGHCPMCRSNDVYAGRAVRFFSSNAKVQLVDENHFPNPPTAFTPYICLQCGFTAMYAMDMEAIMNLPNAKGWEKVSKEVRGRGGQPNMVEMRATTMSRAAALKPPSGMMTSA